MASWLQRNRCFHGIVFHGIVFRGIVFLGIVVAAKPLFHGIVFHGIVVVAKPKFPWHCGCSKTVVFMVSWPMLVHFAQTPLRLDVYTTEGLARTTNR